MYGLEARSCCRSAAEWRFIAGSRSCPPTWPPRCRDAPARWLVTTPIHLRALLAADLDLPGLSGVLTATAPMPAELAREVRAALGRAGARDLTAAPRPGP